MNWDLKHTFQKRKLAHVHGAARASATFVHCPMSFVHCIVGNGVNQQHNRKAKIQWHTLCDSFCDCVKCSKDPFVFCQHHRKNQPIHRSMALINRFYVRCKHRVIQLDADWKKSIQIRMCACVQRETRVVGAESWWFGVIEAKQTKNDRETEFKQTVTMNFTAQRCLQTQTGPLCSEGEKRSEWTLYQRSVTATEMVIKKPRMSQPSSEKWILLLSLWDRNYEQQKPIAGVRTHTHAHSHKSVTYKMIESQIYSCTLIFLSQHDSEQFYLRGGQMGKLSIYNDTILHSSATLSPLTDEAMTLFMAAVESSGIPWWDVTSRISTKQSRLFFGSVTSFSPPTQPGQV